MSDVAFKKLLRILLVMGDNGRAHVGDTDTEVEGQKTSECRNPVLPGLKYNIPLVQAEVQELLNKVHFELNLLPLLIDDPIEVI
jgi:hypothetical protein